jgi:hypothetical protein
VADQLDAVADDRVGADVAERSDADALAELGPFFDDRGRVD